MKVRDPRFQLERIRKYVDDEIFHARIREQIKIENWKYMETGMEDKINDAWPTDYDDSEWADFTLGGSWGGYDRVAWFRTAVPVPESYRNETVALRAIVGPRDGGESTAETLVYINGKPVQAVDVWHEEAFLDPAIYADADTLQISLKSWSGVLGVPKHRVFKEAALCVMDPCMDQFYYTVDTLLRCAELIEEGDLRRIRLTRLLVDTFAKVNFLNYPDTEFRDSVKEALAFLQDGVTEFAKCDEIKPTVTCVGHSHIDMAWLWRYSATREKASRTFTTVLNLMRQFPEYVYMHTSPQLYKFLKEDYPEIFEEVKKRIEDGQWEITGGMWVEADTNLTSGESLARQFLFGKRYMMEEFGKDSTVTWLPDVFGYSGALPQIMKLSDMNYFMTTKISWNQYNHFPHDTFMWKGIDGSEIFTHFITTPEDGSWYYTYNGKIDPEEIPGIWKMYKDKDKNDELLLSFGWGDGGGGPTKDMLEHARVMKNVPGIPKVRIDSSENYFERIGSKINRDELSVWDGELYFEYHRGTYTSQAQIKKQNRMAENMMHNIEFLSAFADLVCEEEMYPKEEINALWEPVLLNQFHDVLPGSSIRQVYEDCDIMYDDIRKKGEELIGRAVCRLSEKWGLAENEFPVFNTIGWTRDAAVFLPYSDKVTPNTVFTCQNEICDSQAEEKGMLVLVKNIPAYGFTTVRTSAEVSGSSETSGLPDASGLSETSGSSDASGLSKADAASGANAVAAGDSAKTPEKAVLVTENSMENANLRAELNENGEIISLYDKKNGREIGCGMPMNVFCAFEDKPMRFDAWDIDIFYREKPYGKFSLTSREIVEDGGLRAVIRQTWIFNKSTLTQDMILDKDADTLAFKTHVDWKEKQVLLKVMFPVDIRAVNAAYEIQYGNIERPTHVNTEWDYAKFEVCAHKWADLSEGGYGVSILNDCKYGHDIHQNNIALTLIKSSIRPDETAGRSRAHEFTYAIYPHLGGFRECDVQKRATELNLPVIEGGFGKKDGDFAAETAGLVRTESDHIVIDTVKRAEDENAVIVRFYEYKNQKDPAVSLTFAYPVKKAVVVNLIERELPEEAADVQGTAAAVSMHGYEVKTLKIYF